MAKRLTRKTVAEVFFHPVVRGSLRSHLTMRGGEKASKGGMKGEGRQRLSNVIGDDIDRRVMLQKRLQRDDDLVEAACGIKRLRNDLVM